MPWWAASQCSGWAQAGQRGTDPRRPLPCGRCISSPACWCARAPGAPGTVRARVSASRSLQRGHQRAVLLLVLQPALGRGAAALEHAPLALARTSFISRKTLAMKLLCAASAMASCSAASQCSNSSSVVAASAWCVALVHAREIGRGGVADDHLDDGRLQHQRAAINSAGLVACAAPAGASSASACVHLFGHIGAAAHGLRDQALALEVVQHAAHGRAAQAELRRSARVRWACAGRHARCATSACRGWFRAGVAAVSMEVAVGAGSQQAGWSDARVAAGGLNW